MHLRRRKNLLWISLIMTMLFGMASVGVPVSAGSTVLAVDPPMKVDTTLTPGSTFHVNVTVADVEKMWGYNFILGYDTTVLTATDYSSYNPFVLPWPSEINDTAGYVAVGYSIMFGDIVGFSTVDPAPIARIDFTVDALGESDLDLYDSAISDVLAGKIDHEAVDGYFRNVESGRIPSAEFTFTPLQPIEREEITFNASASEPNGGEIVKYTWIFADGTNVTETDPITTHNYTWVGNYIVTLAVFDDEDTGIVDTVKHNVTVLAHDITLYKVECSRYELPSVDGRNVSISVTVKNEGHFTETFDFTVYRNITAIETQTDMNLTAGSGAVLEFTWDTTGFTPGNYSISANATVVPYEYDTADNTFPRPPFSDIIVEVRPSHDVAVTKATASPTVVNKGEPVSIQVTVENMGHFPETFNTTAYYRDYLALSPNGNGTYTDWEGDYTRWDDWPSHDGDDTYVSALSDKKFESSTLTDHTNETWSIERVTVNIIARNNETSNEKIRLMLVIGGTKYVGEAFTSTTTYSRYTSAWETNPATDEAWDWLAIDALEAGVESRKVEGWTGQLRVTQLYVEVLGEKQSVAPEITVTDLSAGANTTREFLWDTTGVAPGNYAISASITTSVKDEVYTADNTFTAGIVTVEKSHGVPSASFTYSPEEPDVGDEITFNATASTPDGGTIVSYFWVFGDGANVTETDPIAAHMYAAPGEYTVTLNVTDSEGESDALDQTVTVYPHDVAIRKVTPYPIEIGVGGSVAISVIIDNEGRFSETFNVNTYYNVTATEWAAIGTQTDVSLGAGDTTTKTFTWNTTGVDLGTYIIKAEVPPVPSETDTADNIRNSIGVVTIIPAVHDLAVTNVTASLTEVVAGDHLSINVIVKNEGNLDETFDVSVYYDLTIIETQTGITLDPGKSKTLTFTWNTTGVAGGTYTIGAEAIIDLDDDPADNTYVDGIVTVLAHDIAVTGLAASPTMVAIGDSVALSVTVANEGNMNETFDVSVYYDTTLIETKTDVPLAAGTDTTLTFTWNTTGVNLGTYTTTANASVVSGETNTADNTRTGTVTVKSGSTISISASPTNITIGDTITTSGSINPTREGATVTIWYRRTGETWGILAIVITNENSQYSYDWKYATAGKYEVKASWIGDTNTLEAESDPQTITVKEAPGSDFVLYAVAGIVVVVVAATMLVYFLRVRKPKPT